ncbi:hypothetical protein NQ318_020765 [Aromia moschata]|uniref:Uncharacterized protein n=1 Tax=Aromia moschata TaxID=1265417 RepID=A0AAV8YB46_9CUCU|nr:hypothetical protein NQ318_020765 [Aromia moschata]
MVNLVTRDSPALLSVVNRAISSIFPELQSIYLTAKVKDILFDGVQIDCRVTDFPGKAVCAQLKSQITGLKLSHIKDVFGFSLLGPTPLVKSLGTESLFTCGKSYIGQTGRSIQCRIKEHQRHTRMGNTDKSAIAEHVHTNENHKIDYEDIRVLDKTTRYYPRIIRESLEIMKNNNNFNREDGYRLSNTWRLAIPRTSDLECHGQPSSTDRNATKGVAELGQVLEVDGKTEINLWSTEECNRFKGTDGWIFHPLINLEDEIWTYSTDLCSIPCWINALILSELWIISVNESYCNVSSIICRNMQPKYVKSTVIKGIDVFRYEGDLGDMEHNEEEKCYCSTPRTCLKKGVFDVSKCMKVPIYVTLPHFFENR